MSHITNVRTEITDEAAVRAVAAAWGCTVEASAVPRYYSTAWGGQEAAVCDLVVRLPGKYDLGLMLQADGTYKAMCDTELLNGSFGRNDSGRLLCGTNLDQFMQAYAVKRVEAHVAMSPTLTMMGVETTADGDLVLTIQEG